ncbi:MAG: hypothetical protein ABSG35_14160 [Syntrophobacteraceae bacterium]|jgi:hypothetical protein
MDNKPKALNSKEIEEIAAMKSVRQMWGAENAEEMIKMLQGDIYAAKFDYMSGGPGYVGDLYVLLGDAYDEPLTLVRTHGELKIAK